MKVIVMSRKQAVDYCSRPHDTDVIMISISDPYMTYYTKPFCTPENRVKDILRLQFADADRPGPDVYGRDADESDLMSDDDAMQIAELLQAYPDTDIIAHCDAGISRSSGVAAAILKATTGSDWEVFGNPRFYPNMWCYEKTLKALSE